MVYGVHGMVKGDCLFSATGVTTGSLLSGVRFRGSVIETETIVMRSVAGTARIIKAPPADEIPFGLKRSKSFDEAGT